MNKSSAAVLTAAILVLLTGCAAAADEASSEPETITTVTTDETPAPEETPDELVASGPADMTDAEAEAAFLVEVRDRLRKIRTQIPDATDEQLLAKAHEACVALAPDLTGEDLSLIKGETRTNGHFMDSSAIIVAARLTMCPIAS